MKKRILYTLFLLFVIIQFVRIDKTVPEYDQNLSFENQETVDAQTLNLLKEACYDCHSYETEYPWYAEIAPVSWWLQGHIREAREHINFSIWGTYPVDDKNPYARECVEMIESKEMPLTSFLILHPEARLSNAERKQLINLFEGLK